MLTVLGAASATAAIAATLLSGHLLASVVATFILAGLCGIARAWTEIGPGFGVTVLVTYAVTLAIPEPTVRDAVVRGGYIFIGGLWATLVAVVLWPIRPFRPVRLRVAECYRALARYLEDASEHVLHPTVEDPTSLKSHIIAVRDAIEAARSALGAARLGRSGEVGRGERLLVLHELADQLLVHVIALLEESAALPELSAGTAVHQRLSRMLLDVAGTARDIAVLVQSESGGPRPPVRWSGAPLRGYNASMAAIFDRMADYARTASGAAAALATGAPPAAPGEPIEVTEPPPEPVLFSLSAVLRPDSVVLHHAGRVAIMTTIAVLIGGVLHLNHAYWVTLTVIVILQPYAAATRQKALQRVIGTILGGLVAAGLSALSHTPAAILVWVSLFTFCCVALLPLNYGAYAVFGTPAFVLLAESSAADWHLSGIRIVNTLLGGLLALIGSRLWPGDEWRRLPEYTAAALRANHEFFRATLALVASGATDLAPLRDIRRRVASTAFSAEDSFQRLVSDHRGPASNLEPLMALIVLVRRIGGSIAALALPVPGEPRPSLDDLQPFAERAESALAELVSAVEGSRPPAPMPPIGSLALRPGAVSPVVEQRANRVSRQIRLLHSAITRWLSPPAAEDDR
jgi:uncharacterized membrane protein YccC